MVNAIEDARDASDDCRWGDAWRLWSTFTPESLTAYAYDHDLIQ
jgi:hypothetical protein